MYDYKEAWKARIAGALNRAIKDSGAGETIDPSRIVAEIPPRPDMGDLGFPMFSFAKDFRQAPPRIAQAVAAALDAEGGSSGGTYTALGPYVNIRLDRGEAAAAILAAALGREAAGPVGEAAGPAGEAAGPAGEGAVPPGGPVSGGDFPFGRPGTLAGRRIMVEFSSPNTNKPLHLGHLRNDVLGESVSRILRACGAAVRKVCIINDRGIHICKSMLAYQEYGEGKTPESEHVKSDRFVGDWYVKFHQMAGKSAGGPTPEERAQELLRRWEAGDPETVALWKQMNGWAVEGMKETYRRTGVSFDQYYYESQTYLLGRDEVLKGLEQGLFVREADGAVTVDLTGEQLDKKILLRKDGTSIYITQDIGTAIFRHRDWPFDRLIYVVGSEQQYHFQVLFTILGKLGFDWAKNLYHLSYGMVNLPEGKMKSREGTVVDADDLIDSLKEMALGEIREKEREEEVGDPQAVAEKIALGALHYYLLQANPAKDMLFDPKESLSFNGNTGPYLQYMGARISALLRRAELLRRAGLLRKAVAQDKLPAPAGNAEPVNPGLLTGDPEWELLKALAAYPGAVAAAAEGLDPSFLAAYLYDLSRAFSRFYHDCPILGAAEPGLAEARLCLCRGVLAVLRDALDLICVPFLEAM